MIAGVTVTEGPVYVKRSAALTALVPPIDVTVTSTTPVPDVLVAVMRVALLTVNAVATPPNLTAVAPVNPQPLMVTLVPPEDPPDAGLMDVTAGAAQALANVPTENDHVYGSPFTVSATT
jgi:hypothetical protein